MSKKITTLAELEKLVCDFRDQRGWRKDHTPRNLATSIVLEASELLEIFQWDLSVKDQKDLTNKEKLSIRKEIADVVIYCLSLAEILGIDLSDAVVEKINHNKKKYPTEFFNKDKQDETYYKKIKRKYRSKGL